MKAERVYTAITVTLLKIENANGRITVGRLKYYIFFGRGAKSIFDTEHIFYIYRAISRKLPAKNQTNF